MKKTTKISLAVTAAVLLAISTQITFFIVPPIGAIPEGRTIIITRLNNVKFIDSADAMCERLQGGVSLMCRALTMGAIVQKATIIARLPYSETLYSISTNGKTYDR